MKKVLTLLLILVMSLAMLTSCFGEEWNNRKQNNGQTDAALAAAADFLYNVMKDKEGAENVNDFDVVKKLVVDNVTYEVTWTTDNDKVKIVPSSKASYWTVDIPTTNDTAFSYKLKATIKAANGQTITKEFNRKVPVIGADNALVVSDPQEGVDYKLFIVQYTARKVLFLKGATQNNENKYILGGDAKDGAIFRVEKVEGGVKIYTMIDGTKQYLNAHIQLLEDGQKTSKYLGFSADKPSVFYYKQNVGAWFTMIDNAEYVIGTYSTFETASLSEGKFMTEEAVANKEQFAISFMTKENADTYTPPVFEVPKEPADGSTLTIKEAIDFGNTFAKNGYSSGKFVVTGTIKEIQSDVYGNVVITDGTNEILVYGMYDPAGKRFDKMDTQPKVGDVITVKGVIGKYDAPQIKDGTLTKLNDTVLGGATDDEGIVLNMIGTTTRTEHSTSKTVHSANGVTYTNDKASSTTNNFDQTSSNSARAYKSSVITISAEKAFKRIVFSLDDFSNGQYLTGFDGMTVAGATITRDGDKVTVILTEAKTSFTFGELLAQVRIEQIAVYETAGSTGGSTEEVPDVLNMKGTTTRTEYSTEKTVHSANGVTYTNDKASSTTNNFDNTGTNSARAYKSSVITISAEKAFKRIVFTLDDFSNGQYLTGFDGMTVAGATITRDGDKVTVILAEAKTSFTFGELLAQVRIEQIEVYETAGSTGGGAGEGEEGTMTLVTAPEVGVGYYLRLEQGTLNKILYLNGNTANELWYLASVEDPADAVLVYLEAVSGVDGAYRLYFDKAGTKTYIRVYERDAANKSGSLELVTSAPEEYFTFNSDLKTLMYTKGENSYILNTYNSFDTFCVSHISKASINFVSGLYQLVESGEPDAPHNHDYKATVVAPTCTEAGYTEHKCECGESYKDSYKDALGHKDENGDKICDGCGIDREIYNVVDAPVAGIPYYFGLVQEKLGYNLYFSGKVGNKDYYLATEKSTVAAATRVFLEAVDGVEGAYRLYFETEAGGKIYIRVYERDAAGKSGSLELVAAVPNEYFTYDETLKTLVYTAGENAYYIGTYSNYNTFSVSHVSYAATSYVSHFYALNVTGHHSYSVTKVVDPTCTAKGYSIYTCACGDSYKGDYLDPLPHVDHNDDKLCDDCDVDVRIYEVLIGTPVVGEEYYLGIFQGNLDTVLYYKGTVANKDYYLATVARPLDGVKVYLEEVNELGRRIYFYDAEGTKTYIRVYERDAAKKSGSLELTTLIPVEYFVFDKDLNALVYNAASGNTYYLGTYGTYDTLSVSHIDYATKEGNFVARLYTISAVPHEHLDNKSTVAPKCTEQGYDLHTCPCGYSYKDNFVAAIGHIDANADKACDDCTAVMSVAVDMMGQTTRTEYSAEQFKHLFGSVTVLIDKANSSNDCYDNTNATYAARVYKGMVFSVAGQALIDRIVIKMDAVSNGQYLVGFDGMQMDGYELYRLGDTLVIVFTDAATSFVSLPMNAQARVAGVEVFYKDRAHTHAYTEKVTAATCAKTGKVEMACACDAFYGVSEIAINVNAHTDADENQICDDCYADLRFNIVTAPVVGEGYLFGLVHKGLTGKPTLYFNGKLGNTDYYLAMEGVAFNCVKVYLEAVEGVDGAYRLYFDNEGEKTYIRVYERDAAGKKGSLALVTTAPAEYMTFDTELNTLVHTSGSNQYYIGTYGSYETLSVSHVSYAATSYVCHFYSYVTEQGHQHEYADSTVSATCGNSGHVLHLCACGDFYRDTWVATLPHVDTDKNSICDNGCGAFLGVPTVDGAVAPVAGTAYKLALYQGKLSKVIYLDGGKSGYYGTTVDSATGDANVYIEETTNGFYMYCIVKGVKNYINMTVSGSYVNLGYASTASTVYTFDQELMTPVAVVNNKSYAFGIGASDTYSTFGPVEAASDSFFMNFVPSTVADSEVPSGASQSASYTFADYTAGTQYAANEKHELDANTTVTTTKCHFTSELRIYSSSTNNGVAIIHSVKDVNKITVNASYKVDTLNVYVSDDGVTYTLAGTISVTSSSSYKDYTLDLGGSYNYIKLDVAGSNQIRIKSMVLNFAD